ncbi:hypothetical protein O3P69_011512 [Scylla paramamosain]|uniref:Uncharacterized protein n=1 Tax=Scylla paramamosain TaxID=85552 RepID=A0AAW0T5Y3_SCYPA
MKAVECLFVKWGVRRPLGTDAFSEETFSNASRRAHAGKRRPSHAILPLTQCLSRQRGETRGQHEEAAGENSSKFSAEEMRKLVEVTLFAVRQPLGTRLQYILAVNFSLPADYKLFVERGWCREEPKRREARREEAREGGGKEVLSIRCRRVRRERLEGESERQRVSVNGFVRFQEEEEEEGEGKEGEEDKEEKKSGGRGGGAKVIPERVRPRVEGGERGERSRSWYGRPRGRFRIPDPGSSVGRSRSRREDVSVGLRDAEPAWLRLLLME